MACLCGYSCFTNEWFLLGSISTVALLMSGFGVLVFVQLLCCWCFWLACVAEMLCFWLACVAEVLCYTRGYLPWLPGCRPAL